MLQVFVIIMSERRQYRVTLSHQRNTICHCLIPFLFFKDKLLKVQALKYASSLKCLIAERCKISTLVSLLPTPLP